LGYALHADISVHQLIKMGMNKSLDIKSANAYQQSNHIEYQKYKRQLWVSSIDASVNSKLSKNYPGVSEKKPDLKPSLNSDFSTAISFKLFNGFKDLNNLKQAELNWRNSQIGLNQTKQQIAHNIWVIYIKLALNQHLLELQQNNLNINKEILKAAQKQYRKGIAPKTDWDRAKIDYLNSQQTVIKTQYQLQQIMQDLAQIIGTPPSLDSIDIFPFPDNHEGIIKLPSPLNTDNLSKITAHFLDIYLQKSSQYQQTEIKHKVAQLSLQNIQGNYYPKLSVTAGYQYFNTNNTTSVRNIDYPYWELSINIPLFDNFNTSTKKQKAKINITNTQRDLQSAKNDATNRIASLCQNLLLLTADQKVKKEQIELTKKIYSVSSLRYKKGLISMKDVLQDKTAQTQTEKDMLQLKYEITKTQLDLALIIGKIMEVF